jgi:pyrimidine operon attenuation protein/uracil phosphoribosyltransferase
MALTPTIPDTDSLLTQLFDQVDTLLQQQIWQPLIIGIHTGGVWLAEALYRHLDIEEIPGSLDISFYRDDFPHQGLNPSVVPSKLPFQVNDRHLLLVDDILMTGRTIRASLNEIFDYSRPASVHLVTLCSINNRELPIQPDVCPLALDLPQHQYVQLSGPHPLLLRVIDKAST